MYNLIMPSQTLMPATTFTLLMIQITRTQSPTLLPRRLWRLSVTTSSPNVRPVSTKGRRPRTGPSRTTHPPLPDSPANDARTASSPPVSDRTKRAASTTSPARSRAVIPIGSAPQDSFCWEQSKILVLRSILYRTTKTLVRCDPECRRTSRGLVMKTLPAELIELDEVTLKLVLLMPSVAVMGGLGWIVVARIFRPPVVRTASDVALDSYVGQFWD